MPSKLNNLQIAQENLKLDKVTVENCFYRKGTAEGGEVNLRYKEIDIGWDKLDNQIIFRLDVGCMVASGDFKSDVIEDDEFFAVVEATYSTSYILIDSEISDECIEEFADRNVILHVWPFFRELVYSSLQKMNVEPQSIQIIAPHKVVKKVNGQRQVNEDT